VSTFLPVVAVNSAQTLTVGCGALHMDGARLTMNSCYCTDGWLTTLQVRCGALHMDGARLTMHSATALMMAHNTEGAVPM
jgi:threonine aldolase